MFSLDKAHVLITGGTGSLGQALVRRILTGEMGMPEQITVFSRDEAKQHTMRLAYANDISATDEIIYRNAQKRLRFHIGDVRDYAALSGAVQKADVVINAAALKQVPTCEYFPFEAVQTNVMGAQNLIRAVHNSSVWMAVAVSSDKACQPINAYGMTKAIQERMFVRANVDICGQRFVCVRYGNVIASRGSVIPLFMEQIRHGGPITITEPDMTRFLLSLDKAVDTIFSAIHLARPGEIYVPKVPSAKILDVAHALKDGHVIPMKYIGIRPGEKTHEILVSDEECSRTIERNGYYVIQPLLPELQTESGSPALKGAYSSANTTLDVEDLRTLLAPYREALL